MGLELRRRVRDRSVIVTCLVAPLVLAAILGFAFAGGGTPKSLHIGISGVGHDQMSARIVAAGVEAATLPDIVSVVKVDSSGQLRREVANGTLQGGVALPQHLTFTPAHGHGPNDGFGSPRQMAALLRPAVIPSSGPVGDGIDVVAAPSSIEGSEAAAAVASGVAGRLYAGALVSLTHHGRPTNAAETLTSTAVARQAASASPDLHVATVTIGSGGKRVLDYFAASVAVIFLFIGAGLGMRSLLLERSEGTLVRVAAAPVRPGAVVVGKLTAIFLTAWSSILVVWGATTLLFKADWGNPLGVTLMCLGAALAMSGVAVMLTSLARNEKEAFGISMVAGLLLALLGGNLLPPGSLPPFLQVLSLGTPNGWALIGFGRLSLESQGVSAVFGPFLVLCLIAGICGAVAATRVRHMVQP